MSQSQSVATPFEATESNSPSVAAPVAAVVLTLLAGWVFVLRPTQLQVAGLEHQCGRLSAAVEQLAGQSEALGRSNNLLELVNTQAAIVDSAENSLARLEIFHRELTDRVDHIQRVAASRTKLLQIESSLTREREALAAAVQSLRDLEETRRQVVDAGRTLLDVKRALNVLDELHLELQAQEQDAINATEVLCHLSHLLNGLLASRADVATAAGVAEQWAITQGKLAKQHDQLAPAEQAATQLIEIKSVLSSQSADMIRSKRNLDRMVTIHQELGQQSGSLEASTQALEKLVALDEIVARASTTIDTIQRLVVDICLVQPAEAQTLANLATRKELPSSTPSVAVPAEQSTSWESMRQALQLAAPMWLLR